MTEDEKRGLIEQYLHAYNEFDIDGMIERLHSEIEFKNMSGGELTASASGIEEFRQLAEQSKKLFRSRRQTSKSFSSNDDQASIEVDYEGVLAADLPNGMSAGDTLRLQGRSEFRFRDGRIYRLTDFS